MKTVMNMRLVAMILGVAMTAGTAKADFDAEFVRNNGELIQAFVEQQVRGVDQLDIPRSERRFLKRGLQQISDRGRLLVQLSADDDADDEIIDVALEIKQIATNLANRADGLNQDNFRDLMLFAAGGMDTFIAEID